MFMDDRSKYKICVTPFILNRVYISQYTYINTVAEDTEMF